MINFGLYIKGPSRHVHGHVFVEKSQCIYKSLQVNADKISANKEKKKIMTWKANVKIFVHQS